MKADAAGGGSKKWVFAFLTVLLVIGAIEAIAWLTHIALYEDADSTSSPAFINQSAGSAIHPFYGNIDDSDLHDLNVASPSNQCALVVGLLGGSVALDVSTAFRRALLRHVASLGTDVSPVLVDLSHYGYAQPQQVHALVNKLANGERFDIVVSLDGYNEVQRPSGVWFPFFPIAWFSVIGMSGEQRLVAVRISALRDKQDALLADEEGLYRSATFGLLRRWRLDQIERSVVRHHHDLLEASNTLYSLEKHGPRQTWAGDELRRTTAESWYRSAWVLASLARHHGIEYYHFLQPNQYVPGTKPLTDEEMAKAMDPQAVYAENVRSTYPLLAEYGRRLRERDVEFFDLTRIYEDNRETLYMDGCCHVNRRGNELLAAAMLQRIIEATNAEDGAIYPESENRNCLRPYRDVVARVEAGKYGEPVARSVFDIYRDGRTLVYLKRYCAVDDIEDSFFLQFTSVEKGTPVAGGAPWGPFSRHGVILDGETCVAIVQLEDGAIHWRTGQNREGLGDTWSVEQGTG